MTVPLDDDSLRLLEEAIDCHVVDVDIDGTHIYSGEFTLHRLLEFWSGYDRTLVEDDGVSDVSIYRGGPLLSETDVIRALIAEVRTLRGLG